MTARAVPGFLPSIYGFHFANNYPPGPTVRFGPFDTRILGFGDASAGLCGGMALTARDLFEARVPAPPDTDPPANGSPRFDAIVRRQAQSLDWLKVPLRYLDLQAFRPDPPAGVLATIGREPPRVDTIRSEWQKIRGELDTDHPCVVGLVRFSGNSPWALTRNHQVLGYAYDESPTRIVVRVYDPNHPGDDHVELRADIDADDGRPLRDRVRLSQTTGEPLLGFFRQPYPAPPSMRAWR